MIPCGSGSSIPPDNEKYTGFLKYFTLLGRDLIAREFGDIGVTDDAGFYIHINLDYRLTGWNEHYRCVNGAKENLMGLLLPLHSL
ncbi:hypothetical protein [Xenorhabdus szentirmaii]|uniref:hypothetical protein n=1 Tax=Xenorhabdus szentirmaii TaxID=290112 RepID=UPI002B402BA0|nr:hypothetical protein [Xenorhabdus sp. M]